MNGAVQDDLRNKVSDVVRRLTQDAHKGEFNKRLNNHALYFQDAAPLDDATPHFMCEAGSILRDKECGRFPNIINFLPRCGLDFSNMANPDCHTGFWILASDLRKLNQLIHPFSHRTFRNVHFFQKHTQRVPSSSSLIFT